MYVRFAVLLPAIAFAGCAASTEAADNPAPIASAAEWTAQCEDWDEWEKPAPPFRIHADTYYVGTCGITAILVTSTEGHVLIDSGMEGAAPEVLQNIRDAGFDPAEIRYLLHSHEHFDHTGGHAAIKAATGARVVASEAAALVIGTGRDHPNDPQHGMHEPMRAVNVDRVILDGETVEVGGKTLTAIATPGHTPGALSWQWQSCEGDTCLSIVYADSLSPISSDGYAFSDHPEYTGAFRQGLGKLAALDCDIVLTPHPSASDMVARLKGEAPLVDSDGCRKYADAIGKRLDERLTKEAQ